MSNTKNNKVASNAVFATVNQFTITFAPLITTPYVTRVLGANRLGVFTYTLSIVNYFVLFSLLGVSNYGTRVIAEKRAKSESYSVKFHEIYAIQFAASAICLLLYCLMLLITPVDNLNIAWIQIIWIIGALFDITWFYYGLEEVKTTALCSIIAKVLTIVSIFLFVKSNEYCLIAYASIMALGNLASMVLLWIPLRKHLRFERIHLKDIVEHIRPILVLFVPLLATTVFHNMDKTMLGILSTYQDLSYYYNADMIINVPLGIIIVLGSVFLPKIIDYRVNNNNKEEQAFMYKTFEVVICLTALLGFGIMGCAKEFIPMFFGQEYTPSATLVCFLVPVLFLKAISNFYRMEYLIPRHLDKIYVFATIAGAVVNLILNMLLIPKLSAVGAVLGTIAAEFTVTVVQFSDRDDAIKYSSFLKSTVTYLCIGALMMLVMRMIALINMNVVIKSVLEILAGGMFYLVVCVIYWLFIRKDNTILDTIKSDIMHR